MSLLEIENLQLSIGDTPILKDIDLTIEAGEVMGLVGESGSGKSMTALTVMQLLPHAAKASGRVTFDGIDILAAPEDAMNRLRGDDIGMVFQEPMTALNPVKTIGEQVAEGPRIHLGLDRRAAWARAVGGPKLRAMTFAERGQVLKAMSAVIHEHREALIDVSRHGGTTRGDAKFDIDGAAGTLSYYAYVGKGLGEQRFLRWAGVLGDMLQTANSQAQMSKGNMAPEPVSVGDLFFGAVAPGLLLTAAYIGWIVLLASLRPSACPARRPTSRSSESPGRVLGRLAAALLPALILIVLVLGSILAGIATATESAAMGAVGALGLAVGRGRLSRRLLREVVFISARLSSMAFLLLFGASVLMLVFRGLGGDTMISGALEASPGGLHAAMFAVMAVTFLLGFFLDPFEIIFIVIPVAGPALIGLGADPVWLGVLFAITLQTSFLTPPFGFALFYLRSVAPATLTTGQIYRGVVPFVAIQLLVLAVVWMYEPLATTLPRWIFR